MASLASKAKKLFVDSLRIRVRAGNGGHGLPQYGGIGGKGGDVCIVGSSRLTSLKPLVKPYKDGTHQASNGFPSRRTQLLGESGQDLIIKVPLGVTIEDSEKQILGEINEPRDKVVVALGGRGGDKYNDHHGLKGQHRAIKLDLKMISDAVLVGFPNAGKSSLLGAISKATPTVASYPFTTLKPNLGTMEYKDYRQITVADLPGLVEGAHKNLGLGHEFLKHTVRAKMLVFLIDINDVDLGPSYQCRSPLETLCILNKEIELYDDTILNKPAILVISKMDTRDDAGDMFSKFKYNLKTLYQDEQSSSQIEDSLRPNKLIQFDKIIPVSSKTKFNIDKFKSSVREVLDYHAEQSILHELQQNQDSERG